METVAQGTERLNGRPDMPTMRHGTLVGVREVALHSNELQCVDMGHRGSNRKRSFSQDLARRLAMTFAIHHECHRDDNGGDS